MAAVALSACATQRPQADITRFHLNQPVPKGTIHVSAADPARAGSLEARAYNSVVEAELQRLGFTVAPQPGAEYIALVTVTQEERAVAKRNSGLSIGVGGGFGSGNVGMGGSVQVPVGGTQGQPTTTATTLMVTIQRQSDKSMVWEGRATSSTGNGPATDVPKLAAVLFRDFPGASGQSVRVNL